MIIKLILKGKLNCDNQANYKNVSLWDFVHQSNVRLILIIIKFCLSWLSFFSFFFFLFFNIILINDKNKTKDFCLIQQKQYDESFLKIQFNKIEQSWHELIANYNLIYLRLIIE